MPVQSMIDLSLALRRYINWVGKWGALFILPLVFVTAWDIVFRKLGGVQYWMVQNLGEWFGSTIIQELEWHFHTVLFTMVLGYAYVNNRHVRVDLVREKLSFRKQAFIEFIGCTFFMIPFCVLILYHAVYYAYDSYVMNEISASMVGLPSRWIIKTVLAMGIFFALLSGIAVWLQAVLVLFGPREVRYELMTLEWPEEQERGSSRIQMEGPKEETAEGT